MKRIFIFISVLLPVLVLGQSTGQNFIKTTTYREENAGSPVYSVTYLDGLGRPIQQIAHKQSGAGNDIVTHIEYDAFGRQVKEYLPIVDGQSLNYHSIDNTSVNSYYSTPAFPGMETTSNPYSEKLFEASPLNKVLKQAAPGDDWHMGSGHEVKFDYQTNEEHEVRLFGAFLQSDYTPGFIDNDVYYEKNTLYKTITKDENWIIGNDNTTEEFKDKEGKIVLKRTFGVSMVDAISVNVAHDTYYVYDDYGNLAFVIPPIVDISHNIDSSVLDGLCYQYKYDYRNRLIEKKIPGKQREYIAYNSQDMPVATGPVKNPWGANTWGWLITKYDSFGRIVYTGWVGCTDFPGDRIIIESYLNGSGWFENFTGAPTTIDDIAVNYSNVTQPLDLKLLTINYYDSYTYVNAPTLPSDIEGQPVLTNVKSLSTGSWVRILDGPNNTTAEVSYTLYDTKGRVIRIHKANYLGGSATVDSKLDFTGKPIYTNYTHKRDAAGNEIAVSDNYEYTPQDRLFSHTQQINGGNKELIAKNDYDDLGQLISKQVGGEDITTYVGLQKVDYSYNIRGWLKNINNVDDLTLQDETADLFAFKINYNTVENNVSNQVNALYNGNISETFWRSNTDNVLRKYGYKYDTLNRLTNSFYQKPNRTVPITNMYNEQMSYDKNGNIQTMQRNGDYDSDYYGAIQIDSLSYDYDNHKKNQLLKVTDATNSPKGFKDDSDGTNDISYDYIYDDNGNMTADENKDIGGVTYNHLNLPIHINFGTVDKIEYLYDATGQKKKKKVTEGANETITDYLDGYQYTNTILNFFSHAEGYVNVTYCPECQTEFQTRYNYVYQYKDHLGNIRVSYGYDQVDEVLKIIEEHHYYPFGLKHTKYNSGKSKYGLDEEFPELMKLEQVPAGEQLAYKYKYNGKEYQDELGLNMYDYGARNYDPALGRWMNIDQLAEQYRRWSPYNYCVNNPMRFVDPDGMSVENVIVNGPQSKEAVSQLQASAGTDITLNRDEASGNVTYTNNTGAPLTGNAAKLASVIDDHSVNVNVNADNSNQSIEYGEAFMGNTVTSNVDSASGKNIVNADQAVNTKQTASLDAAGNKPGASILHGVVEAFEGAKMSQASGDSSPQAGSAGSVYQAAHNATELIAPQPAQVNKVHSYYGASNYIRTGIGAQLAVGLYLGNSNTLAPGVVPTGTVSVTTQYYANGIQLDK